jgi:precorrin-2 dehydrogenase/sirohydrochlorin ferrochelatase
MPRYYPIYLDIKGKRCVVVGGGEVAYRKALGLKEAGAEVVVISPKFSAGLLKKKGLILLKQKYEARCLEGATLVIAATSDKKINRQVWEETQRHGLLINVVDQPELCNFIVPSVVSRGDLLISISTGGASPALARRIREELEERFGQEYADFIYLLSKLRPLAQASLKNEEERRRVLERLASPKILEIVKNKGVSAAGREMRKIVLKGAKTGSKRGKVKK